MTTSFFNGAFFGGEFFNTPAVVIGGTPVTDAGGRSAKRKRKVIIGDRLYEVDSLRDVELILKRTVRDEAEPATRAANARVRVVDRVSAKLDKEEAVRVPVDSAEVDWSALWNQLAMQDMAYALELERVLRNQEEDDIEAILLLH